MSVGAKYYASYSYEATDNSQLSVVEGEVFELVEPDSGGWSLVKNVDLQEGWIPTTCCAECDQSLPLSRPGGASKPYQQPPAETTPSSTSSVNTTSSNTTATTGGAGQVTTGQIGNPLANQLKMQQLLAAAAAQQEQNQPAAPKVEMKSWKGKYFQPSKFLGSPIEHFLASEFTRIPTFFWNATNFLENKALSQEGIYRLSPALDKFDELVKQLDEHPDMPFPLDTNANIVAHIIKRFLRELPEPLITSNLYDAFIAAGRENDEMRRGEMIMANLERLPVPHRDLLCLLFSHLVLVAAHEKENKMGITNLSTIFCPCIFRGANSLLSGAKEQGAVFTWLLRNISYVLTKYPLPPPSFLVSFTGPSSYAPDINNVVEEAKKGMIKNLSYNYLLYPYPPLKTPAPRKGKMKK